MTQKELKTLAIMGGLFGAMTVGGVLLIAHCFCKCRDELRELRWR